MEELFIQKENTNGEVKKHNHLEFQQNHLINKDKIKAGLPNGKVSLS